MKNSVPRLSVLKVIGTCTPKKTDYITSHFASKANYKPAGQNNPVNFNINLGELSCNIEEYSANLEEHRKLKTIVNNQYLGETLADVVTKHHITCTKSGMGTGKTFTAVQAA